MRSLVVSCLADQRGRPAKSIVFCSSARRVGSEGPSSLAPHSRNRAFRALSAPRRVRIKHTCRGVRIPPKLIPVVGERRGGKSGAEWEERCWTGSWKVSGTYSGESSRKGPRLEPGVKLGAGPGTGSGAGEREQDGQGKGAWVGESRGRGDIWVPRPELGFNDPPDVFFPCTAIVMVLDSLWSNTAWLTFLPSPIHLRGLGRLHEPLCSTVLCTPHIYF